MTQPITESSRFALQRSAREALGEQEGDTLMAHLPPVGWADVATKRDVVALKQDLVALEERIDHRFEVHEHRTRAEMERGFRRQTMWLAALFAAQATAQLGMVLWAIDQLAA